MYGVLYMNLCVYIDTRSTHFGRVFPSFPELSEGHPDLL